MQARTSPPVGLPVKPFVRGLTFDHACKRRMSGWVIPTVNILSYSAMNTELDYFGTQANSYGFQVVHTVSETPGHRVMYPLKRQGSGKRLSTSE